MQTKTYTNTTINPAKLYDEILASSITITPNSPVQDGSDAIISFKADISASEETILDSIVSAHNPAEEDTLVIQPVSVEDRTPFAKPDFRTKMNATTNWESFDQSITDGKQIIDFQLTQERYVTGGEILYKDAKEGDYITAEVYDKDGVIPDIPYGDTGLTYRQALCENWPSVAEYVEKRWLLPCATGEYRKLAIDTYPLNAKISAGLYLRITYHVNDTEAGTRKCAVNYNLTKKL